SYLKYAQESFLQHTLSLFGAKAAWVHSDPVMASGHMEFRRGLRLFQAFTVRTQVLTFDEKAWYIKHVFIVVEGGVEKVAFEGIFRIVSVVRGEDRARWGLLELARRAGWDVDSEAAKETIEAKRKAGWEEMEAFKNGGKKV
ncbi:hypothetical protein BDK51DRAFT_32725, partial [Blyttiomyces helicus]